MKRMALAAREGFVAAAVAAAVCGCSGAGAGDDTRASGVPDVPIPAVEAVQARLGTLPLYERLTGTVRASGEVAIFPQISGVVAEVFAANGDAVAKGAALVRIQAPGSAAQVEQARSSLAAARAERTRAEANLGEIEAQFKRTLVLGEEGLVALDVVETQRAQVEAARAAMHAARAQVALAEATLAERTDVQGQLLVRAPIAGRIGRRNAEVGLRVDPQTPLFIIGRLDHVRVEVPVTQETLAKVREGQRVDVRVGATDGVPIRAQVSRMSPFLEAGSYSAEIEIDVDNDQGRLVPGMFVTVDLQYGESEQSTIVPSAALYEHPATRQRGVYVVPGGLATTPTAQDGDPGRTSPPVDLVFRPLDVVAEGPQTVGVEGLAPGDWVVVVGQHLLSVQEAGQRPRARVRPLDWDRILELQRLQHDDLLRGFMERQQQLARQPVARSSGAPRAGRDPAS
jgi:RND family efflux transporter MFP subunit